MTKQDLWNAHLYDSNHQFVSTYGQSLITLLQPLKGERILDVGCGTGDLANEIHSHGADVVGIDQSENMVASAQSKYPHLTFLQADATSLPFQHAFDAVFSNATLHWIKTPQDVIQSIYDSLKDGGRFVAEFGGKGNVQTITDALIAEMKVTNIPYTDEQFPWYFPSIAEYTKLLENAGFHVTFAQHYERPTKLDGEEGLRNWLDMFSPSLFEHVAPSVKAEVFNATIARLRSALYNGHEWIADYKRLRIIAIK